MEEDCCLMLICMSVKYWNVKGKDLSSCHVINTAGQKVLIFFPSKHDFVLLTKMVCVFILFLSKGVDLHHFDQLCHDMSLQLAGPKLQRTSFMTPYLLCLDIFQIHNWKLFFCCFF